MKIAQNSNYLLILLKFGLVLLLLVVFSDVMGQWYQGTEQYRKMETTLRLSLLQTELKILPRKTVFPSQVFYLSVKRMMEWSMDNDVSENRIFCGSQCRAFVVQTNWRNWTQWDNYQFARWYYELGLESYKDGNNAEAFYFMDLARRLAPEWSYYHLELANFFFLQGQIQRGQQVLKECQQFVYGRLNCQLSERDKLWNQHNAVGFLSDTIQGSISDMEFLK